MVATTAWTSWDSTACAVRMFSNWVDTSTACSTAKTGGWQILSPKISIRYGDSTTVTADTTTTSNAIAYWMWQKTEAYAWTSAKPDFAGRLREIIRARQAPLHLPSHRKLLQPVADERELRARAAFRRIVGEHNWRTYCAKGYVSVRAKSGKVYQIFAGHDVTRVYEEGRLIERLCVQLAGEYPPTDAILMRYVLVLSDEATFRRVANHTIARFDARDVVRVAQTPTRNLVEEWKQLRAAA